MFVFRLFLWLSTFWRHAERRNKLACKDSLFRLVIPYSVENRRVWTQIFIIKTWPNTTNWRGLGLGPSQAQSQYVCDIYNTQVIKYSLDYLHQSRWNTKTGEGEREREKEAICLTIYLKVCKNLLPRLQDPRLVLILNKNNLSTAFTSMHRSSKKSLPSNFPSISLAKIMYVLSYFLYI